MRHSPHHPAAEEVDLSTDLAHWNKLTDDERHFIKWATLEGGWRTALHAPFLHHQPGSAVHAVLTAASNLHMPCPPMPFPHPLGGEKPPELL